MAKRRSEQDEWNSHQDEIRRLYVEDDRTLSEVAELMAQRHGFKRTYAQRPRPRIKAHILKLTPA